MGTGTGVDLSALAPQVLTDEYGAHGIIERSFAALFINGQYPYWYNEKTKSVVYDSPLAPRGARLIRSSGGADARHGRDERSRLELWEGPGWVLYVNWSSRDGETDWDIIASTPSLAKKVAAKALARAKIRVIPPMKTEMAFVFSGPSGRSTRFREVDLVKWEDISLNYPTATRNQLETLIEIDPDKESLRGKLLLLHGPTGTGKTTYLRALTYAWQDWCKVEMVMDPEKLFGDANYLISVALGRSSSDQPWDDDREEQDKWRLLVLEDTGELLTGEAKKEMGQQLSRLLNTTDGMLGQGLKLMVAITSNEDLSRFHPAVTRPGRCLSNVEVPEFTPPQAKEWLEGDLPEWRDYSLAELITLREGGEVEHRGPELLGQYA